MLLSTFAVPIGWKQILRRTSVEIYRGNCCGWAAQLAYYFFFALFPALLLVVSVASFLPIQGLIDRGVSLLGLFAPGDVLALARDQLVQVTREPHVALLLVGLVGAIWSASSGMTASIDTLNQVHQIREGRPWWRVRVTAMLLTFTLAMSTLIALTLVMVGPTVAEHIANGLGLGPLVVWAWRIVRVARSLRACRGRTGMRVPLRAGRQTGMGVDHAGIGRGNRVVAAGLPGLQVVRDPPRKLSEDLRCTWWGHGYAAVVLLVGPRDPARRAT
jgi:Virulence factor BrkB